MVLSFSLVLVGSGFHSGAVNASSAYTDTYFAGPTGHSKPNITDRLWGVRWFAGSEQKSEGQQSGLAVPPTLGDLGAESDEGLDIGSVEWSRCVVE